MRTLTSEFLGRGLPGYCLLAAVLVYAFTAVALYPPTYSILDEQGYLSFALAIGKGHLRADEAGISPMRGHPFKGHVVPSFAPGTSALLAPVSLLDWRASFAVNLILHFLGFLAFLQILRGHGIQSWLSVLYLLHPVASLYARTAMSDTATTVLMVAGLAAYLAAPPRVGLAGFAWGLTPLFRFSQVPALAALLAASLIRDLFFRGPFERTSLQRTRSLLIGMLPGLILWMILNAYLYGHPLEPPAAWPLSAEYLPANLSRYLLSQNLIYPLALAVAFFYPSPLRLESALLASSFLALYGCFRHLYVGYGWLGTLLIGDRFFLPLFPFLALPYCLALQRLLALRPALSRPLLVAGFCVLCSAHLMVSVKHQQVLQRQLRAQQLIYAKSPPHSAILCNYDGREYLFDGFGPRRVYVWDDLKSPSGSGPSSLPPDLTAAAPELYVVLTSRLDRSDQSDEDATTILDFLRDRFQIEPVAGFEAVRFRFQMFRVLGQKSSQSRNGVHVDHHVG